MLVEIKYEYETKPKQEKISIRCVNDNTVTVIDAPNNYYRGTSYVTVKEDVLYDDVVKAFSEWLRKEKSVLNIIIKKIKRLRVIEL